MKTLLPFITAFYLIIFCIGNVRTQDVSENRLKLEFEPGLIYSQGRSLMASYNVTESNNFGVGIYLMSSNIPEQFGKQMINNLPDNSESRVTAEYALNLRYRFNIFKNVESNPYLGVILGWENIEINAPFEKELNISTFLATPHIGYEIYVYKKMIYLNPQIRSVFYVGQEYSVDDRDEELRDFMLLPSLSVGVRL